MSHTSQNSKSILARALAEENIKVVHDPSLQTAMFDVANRVLMLPVWDVSPECYDLLVGHEIGHALYTPDVDAGKDANCVDGPWTSVAEDIGGNVHAGYVQGLLNIVEDVRIERKVKEKYPGLRRDFAIGYREMFEKDFFGTNGKDISKMSFADRLNIHFKVGAYLAVPFSAEEQMFVDRLEKSQSFDDTCAIASDIFAHIGGKRQHLPKPPQDGGSGAMNNSGKDANNNSQGQGQQQNGNQQEGNGTAQNPNAGDQQTNPQGQGQQNPNNENQQNQNGGSAPQGAGTGHTLEQMTTQNNFDQRQQQTVDRKVVCSNYYTLPNAELKNIIIPYKKVNNYLSTYFNNQTNMGYSMSKIMARIDTKYAELINKTRPMIGQLIQQFDMKKAADEQKRTTTARSGKLDCDRLCLHKITDDIFLNYSTVADGKNHGMVMVIDWSSSMQMMTEDVLTQVVMLTQFCHRMKIPFDVYLFSSNYECAKHCGHIMDFKKQWDTNTKVKSFAKAKASYSSHDRYAENGEIGMHDSLSLIHVLSSDMAGNELNAAMKNLFTLGQFTTRPKDIYETNGQNHYCGVAPPHGFGQGNTPLDTTILAMMKIVPEFQNKHKVQIVNTVFLTDGETGYSPIRVNGDSTEMVSVVSPINGKEYDVSEFRNSTDALLHIFGDVTGSTTIGFFVCGTHGHCPYISSIDRKETLKVLNDKGFIDAPKMRSMDRYDYAKNGYVKGEDVRNHGYDRLFIIPMQHNEIEDVDDALDALADNATFTKIRNTFIKAVSNRVSSRGLINRFADVIAQPVKR
jgi:hypothetical protein